MDVVNTFFRMEALKAGMCSKFASEWIDDCTEDELIEKYKNGIKFCVDKNFPSADVVDEFFNKDVLRRHHVFVRDEAFRDENFDGICVIRDGSAGEIHFGKTDVATLYVLDDSEVYVVAGGISRIFVHAYGKCHIIAEQIGNGRITVSRHGEDNSVLSIGDVKIVRGTAITEV